MAYMGFKKLEGSLKGDVKNPAAVAASIGRKKYGAKKFGAAAAKGESMRDMEPARRKAGAALLNATAWVLTAPRCWPISAGA